MGYADSTLTPGEAVVYRSRLHWSLFWGPLVWGLVLAFLTAGIGLLVTLPWWLFTLLQWASSEFAVTTTRVILKTGVLRRRSLEMVLNRVESVSVNQGYGGRLFSYGTVLVVGTGGSREPFPGIAQPLAFREAVMGQLGRLTAS